MSMRLSGLTRLCIVSGLLLFAGGVTMRVYARLVMDTTERQLIAARPASAADVPPVSPGIFDPADGPPTLIRLPSLGLWNTLQPVNEQIAWHDGEMSTAWQVQDAGWHASSGWPGYGSNVVLAGHSPSRDPAVWKRSVFRQLAYLAAGDPVELIAGSRVYRYAVSRVFVIPESEAQSAGAAAWIAPTASERLTLVTCWPPQRPIYRVLVVALPVYSLEGFNEP